MKVGAEIRRCRQSTGLSQEQLAERAGLHRNHVGYLERGERNASLKALIAVARALGTSPASFFAALDPSEDRGDAMTTSSDEDAA